MATEATKVRRRSAPKGYEKKNSDVVGYWSEDEPIHFIPRSVKLLDGNIDKTKPSIIIVGELQEPTILSNKDADPFQGEVGQIVGVWYKPGMRDIAKSAGLKVWLDKDLEADGETQKLKKMKKGNPMKLYVVQSAAGPEKRIPINEDTRKEARHVATPFDDPNLRPLPRRAPVASPTDAHEEEEQVDDNVPF